VAVIVPFMSTESVHEVERQVAGRLSKVGWTGPTQAGPGTWFDEVDGRQVEAEHYIDRWTKRLRSGMTEHVTLQVAVPLDSPSHSPLSWLLGATAASVGGPVMHCGEG